jgi:hypothetical protein
MSVTEMWIPVQWWPWKGGALPLIASGPAGLGLSDFSLNRWVRMVRYHLHISHVNNPDNPDDNAFDDTGKRLLNEIVDLKQGFDAASTAIPPQFTIVSQNSSVVFEDVDNKFYSLPRVQRVVTTQQNNNEPSRGMPSAAMSFLSQPWRVEPLPASVAAELLQKDGVSVVGGPPLTD